MTTLVIDIGNTRLKWGLDSAAGFVFGGECGSKADLIESLFGRHWAGLNPARIMISCVGNDTIKQQLLKAAKSRWDVPAEILVSPKQGYGITNAYKAAERLGSDRWAAMVAAFTQMKGPVCLVDSGTAVTLDVIDNEGLHLGGLILPGYGLMPSCLQKGTRLNVEVPAVQSDRPELGRSTESCIQQGTSLAISSMVNALFGKLTNDLVGIRLILTGGDAGLLQNQLEHESTIEPHLVLQGLAIMTRTSAVAN